MLWKLVTNQNIGPHATFDERKMATPSLFRISEMWDRLEGTVLLILLAIVDISVGTSWSFQPFVENSRLNCLCRIQDI